MITGRPDPAERRGRRGPGERTVPVDDSGATLKAKLFPKGCVLAQQTGGQAEFGGIGRGNSGVEIGNPLNL